MSQAPIWPVAPDAFIGDTTHLSAEETGAYIMLLMCLWRNNGNALPLDHKKLPRMARVAPQRWKKVWAAIEDLFIIDGELITQKRLHNDWLRVQEKLIKNRRNAAKGGRTKALNNKDSGIADAIVSAGPKSPIGVPNHKPEPDESKINNKMGLEGEEFPQSGSIAYTVFADIAREHGNGWDKDLLADKFRPWAIQRKIPHENWARAFPGFCKSYGKNKGAA